MHFACLRCECTLLQALHAPDAQGHYRRVGSGAWRGQRPLLLPFHDELPVPRGRRRARLRRAVSAPTCRMDGLPR